MSRIYFHAEHTEAEVLGSERAWLSRLTQNIAAAVFDLATDDQVRAVVPTGHWLHSDPSAQPGVPGNSPVLRQRFGLFLGSHSADRFTDGEEVFAVVLNTALAVGNSPVQLAARIHGQCELHAYVEAEDCNWLADLIEEGRQRAILRDGAGWESAVELLRSQPGPVVTSYSVSESFPNSGVAAWEPEQDRFGGVSDAAWDAWYDLSESERWRLGLDGLRSQPTRPRLDPDTWDSFYFDSGKTAFDYLHAARATA